MESGKPRRGPVRIAVPSRSDPLLRLLTELVGGPLGRRTAPGIVDPGLFTVERVLIMLTTAAALVAVLVKTPCRVNGWSSPAQFSMACYSDWPELFMSKGLAEGAFPFLTEGASLEYPVLLGLLAGGTALLVPDSVPGEVRPSDVLLYFDVNTTLAAGAWVVTVLATMRLANRRPWDAAMVAVAPGIVVAGTINWDLWAAMLTVLGMLAFARRHPLSAGVFLGLGTALKVYPVLVLGAVLILALRTGRFRAAGVAIAAASATVLAVNLPFALRQPDSWAYFFEFTRDRGAGYSSAWYAFNVLGERLGMAPLGAEFINAAALALFAVSCGGIAVLGLAAPRRPRLAQLALLIVGAFILTNKVYSPQFVVWFIPLVALAYPRWRTFLVWQFLEVIHWWAVWMHLAQQTGVTGPQNTLDPLLYVMTVAGHMLGTAYIMYRVAEEILDPRRDPVRRLGIDDPQGGPFDQAPDRWRLTGRGLARVGLAEPSHPAKEHL